MPLCYMRGEHVDIYVFISWYVSYDTVVLRLLLSLQPILKALYLLLLLLLFYYVTRILVCLLACVRMRFSVRSLSSVQQQKQQHRKH